MMLEHGDRQELVHLIAGLYDFTDGGIRARRLLLEQTDLLQYVPMSLDSSAHIVAQDLVGRLERKGYLVPERPNYHALGALVTYLLDLGELSDEQVQFLATLVVRYSLVRDDTYINELRSHYNISATPVQPPLREKRPSPPPPFFHTDVPDFAITLLDEQGLERVINSEDNFLDIYLLAGAIYSSQAVCQIENSGGGEVQENAIGTGFLIGPDLLLTNQHVVENQRRLNDIRARFGYQIDANGIPQPGHTSEFSPDFYYSSESSSLDYALLRLKDQPLKHLVPTERIEGLSFLDLLLQGKHRGYLVLAERSLKEKDRVNIVQHPNGRPMKVTLTQNYIVADMSNTRVQYVADTMNGSSGSPLFNQRWEVVALHHSGKPYPPDNAIDILKKAWKGRFRVNEGIPMRAILQDFRSRGLDRYLPSV